MATIKYNYSNVQKCAYKVRSAADTIGEQVGRLDSVIAEVQAGWTGAGANEYISFCRISEKIFLTEARIFIPLRMKCCIPHPRLNRRIFRPQRLWIQIPHHLLIMSRITATREKLLITGSQSAKELKASNLISSIRQTP